MFLRLIIEQNLLIAAVCYSNSGRKSMPSVIVIGSGVAGIAAARALHDAEFEVYLSSMHDEERIQVLKQVNFCVQVVVLESRDRIGGRVHTDYSFGFPLDLGASW